MTNEELKKKICKIIADNYLPKEMPDRLEDYKLYRFKRAADALIAAGLKFDTIVSHTATFDLAQQEYINSLERRVAELEESDASKEQSSINYYCEMREWKDKCKEAEHRAARAERAFKIYLKDTPECEECIDRMNGVCNANIEEKADCANSAFRLYKEYAEKELAKEKKE